jgi:hypothetical protein
MAANNGGGRQGNNQMNEHVEFSVSTAHCSMMCAYPTCVLCADRFFSFAASAMYDDHTYVAGNGKARLVCTVDTAVISILPSSLSLQVSLFAHLLY